MAKMVQSIIITLDGKEPVVSQYVLHLFRNRCVLCDYPTLTVHEIEPKSQRPKDWDHLENRVAVCTACHMKVHQGGAKNYAEELRRQKDIKLERYGYRIV